MIKLSLWTYTIVDLGLVSDDLEAARTLEPRRAWTADADDPQAWQRIATLALEDLYDGTDGDDDFDRLVLDDFEVEERCSEYVLSDDDLEIRVYRLEVL